MIASLARKILWPALVLVTISLLCMGGALSFRSSQQMEAALDSKGAALAQLVAKLSSQSYENLDYVGLDSMAHQVARDSSIRGVGFFDAEGKLSSDSALAKGLDDGDSVGLFRQEVTNSSGAKLGSFLFKLETPSFKEQFLGNLADIAVVMGLALAILGIGMTIIIRRVLIHRLENLIHIAKEIATGRSDSGKRLPEEPADELGQLSHWINQFSDNLGVVLRNLSQMSQNLAQGTKGIYSNLTHVSDQSDAGAQDADLVDQKTSNVSDSVTSLSQEVLLLSESVSTIAAASEELTASLQQVTQICENELQISDQASAKAREVENLVDHLDEQFQQVSKILEVIDSIAANTNLLALNATIEAARAGEAGKGFAVVASEVKDLARKTAQATGSIGSEMESMRVAVTQTVSSIKQISEVNKSLQVFSNQVLQAVREQSATVNGMSQSLSKTETVARGIAHGAEVASTELRGAQHGIHGIRGRSVETASSIATIKRSLSEMQQLAEQLEKVGMSS